MTYTNKLASKFTRLAGTAMLALTLSTASAMPVFAQHLAQNLTRTPAVIDNLAPTPAFAAILGDSTDRPFNGDLAFYETIFAHGPIEDVRLPFLFANAYIATSQLELGLAYFEEILARNADALSPAAHSTHLAAYALLRATHADDVPLLSRIGWVNDTFDILDQAHEISAHSNPLVYWSAGIIYTQVPGFFNKREAAIEQLQWLADHPETEPLPGFYREAWRHLGLLHERAGNDALAANFHRRSGYGSDAPQMLFTGWYAVDDARGLRFSPNIETVEIVEDRVFSVHGAGFSTIYFVVSDDGEALFAIDAGTQPFAFEAALADVRAAHPGLPPLTDLFVTHAHWDHIGGIGYVRDTYPDLRVHGRDNYASTLVHSARSHAYETAFRSDSYTPDWFADYQPDNAISTTTELTLSGTRINLIPVISGETDDGLLIEFPDLETVFAGDVLMPFFGEPWTQQGHPREVLQTIDTMIALDATHILHGHRGITAIYPDTASLAVYRDAHAWLVDTITPLFETGHSAEEIIRMNLIPPSLAGHEAAYMGYLSPRNHLIRRIGDTLTGIWRADSTGLEPRDIDVISAIDRGRMLEVHFGLSANQIARGVRSMIDAGDLELALQTAIAAEGRYPNARPLAELRREAADRLRNLEQFFNPFSFTVYTQIAGRDHPGMPRQ